MHHRPLGYIAVVCLVLLSLSACGPKTRTLTITVRDADDGAPLANARVSVGDLEASATAAGSYAATLELGEYAVAVSAPGHVAQQITLTLGKDPAGLERVVALEPRRLTGAVRDAGSGQPLVAALVRLGDLSTSLEADGAFALVARESAALSATCAGYLSAELTSAQVEALFAPDGTQRESLTLTLAPRLFSGRVVEAGSDAPIAGAQVSLGHASTQTDADGRFELTQAELGQALIVLSQGYRPYEPVAYEGQTEQRIVLTPWQIAAVATDAATGQPLGGVMLSSGEQSATTDATGLAVLRAVPPAEITATLDGYAPQTLAFTGQETWEVALEPTRLRVLVRDQATGLPLPDVTVQLLSDAPAPTLARTDADGRLTLDDIAGVRELRVKTPGYWLASALITRTGALTLDVVPLQARGIYVPFGLLAVPDYVMSLLDLVDTTDLNAVVIDVKSDKGYLAWESAVPLAVEIGAYQVKTEGVARMDIRALVDECHKRGIYAIARVVVFKDDVLAQARPEFAVKKQDGALYTDYASQFWVDPFRQEVRDYNAALAVEAAGLGFDEVQFDYVRFPTEGPKALVRVYSQEDTTEGRVGAIAAYLKQAHAALSLTPAFVSADIFGLNVWVKAPADNNVGQRLEDLAPYLDYVSPMLYPATFWPGNLGLADPAAYPYLIPYLGTAKSQERAPQVAVRPWLQYYSWGEPAYDAFDYLLARRGAEDAGGLGWLFWNAKGKYQAEVFDPALYAAFEEDLTKAIAAEQAAAEAE